MSKMTDEEEALDKLESLGKLPETRFSKVNVSPDMERMVANFRRQVATTLVPKMQEYVDERDHNEMGIHDTKVAELFNDFITFMFDGDTHHGHFIKDPTEGEG